MKEMNENPLIDDPQFAVHQLGLQKNPANTRERSGHF
jgi:hypothetical protein